ncbi:MAG: hypothetical protein D6796_17275 [Caldilineae bacterium]|nr:MAG: hypothetical protein D6796_17275 [Caldilineae bacterium]
MTQFAPVFRTPIEAETAPGDETLFDLSGAPIRLLQQPVDSLPGVDIPPHPGDVTIAGDALLCRLTPAELYLFGKTPAAELPPLPPALRPTDLTHGRAVLKLRRPDAAAILSTLCGLDFHDSAFPNLQVRQTSAAKVKTLIARADEDGVPTYYLHVSRSFGQYFWDTLRDAMHGV